MEKYLEYLQFSTAIPFGYVMFFIFCVVIIGLGIKNIISSLYHKKFLQFRFVASVFAIFFVSTVITANVMFENRLDLNPFFDESDVIGSWKDDNSIIQFKDDKTVYFSFGERYVNRVKLASGEGTWSKHKDFNIEIIDTTKARSLPLLRMIKIQDEYRIILDDFEDPDMWDHHLGFKKQKSSPDPLQPE